jgi:hypothetical protein
MVNSLWVSPHGKVELEQSNPAPMRGAGEGQGTVWVVLPTTETQITPHGVLGDIEWRRPPSRAIRLGHIADELLG